MRCARSRVARRRCGLAASLIVCSTAWIACAGDTSDGTRGAGPSAPRSTRSGAAGAIADDAFGNTGSTPKQAASGPSPTENAPRSCKVVEGDGEYKLPVCKLAAAPDSFEPKLQWSAELGNGFGPPLVANLTDDNGDGVIDLCDIPDVVVVAGFEPADPLAGKWFPDAANIYVLDGATGAQHFMGETTVTPMVTPAIGDIDGDGLPEIVALGWLLDQFLNGEQLSGLVAFDHTGKVKWQVPLTWDNFRDQQSTIGINLHDMDGDGQVEVIVSSSVYDGKTGTLKWNADDTSLNLASVVVDLDMDGKLELVTGLRAFDAQGTLLWDRTDLIEGNGFFADLINRVGVYPLVANLDDDPFPEILLAAGPGVYILEHDGTTKLGADGNPLTFKSTVQGLDFGDFHAPTAHDFDGDGKVDIALGAGTGFTVLDRNLQPIYEYAMIDEGLTATTAFDFLGDGEAEAIYADRDELLFFDVKQKKVVMSWPHSGMSDYPIVVDVDNDNSAEVVLVSGGTVDSSGFFPAWVEKTAPTVQVLTDAQNRWVPTRRIWNMANYHVTHIREDGTIPPLEVHHYLHPNTFRTNIQYEAGGICIPEGPD